MADCVCVAEAVEPVETELELAKAGTDGATTQNPSVAIKPTAIVLLPTSLFMPLSSLL